MFERLGVRRLPQFVAAALALAGTTTAAWYASFAMPDIFAATTVAGLTLLIGEGGSLSLAMRSALAVLTMLSCTFHVSHLLDGIVVLLAAAPLTARGWTASVKQRRVALIGVGAVIISIAAVVISGYFAFGELSIAPKHFPLTLARVIEDGPGRRYLLRECPKRHYEICTVMADPPGTAAEILFGPRGLNHIATAQQSPPDPSRDSVFHTFAAYPREVIGKALEHSLLQLSYFGLKDLIVDERVQPEGPGVIELVRDGTHNTALRDGFARLTDAVGWLTLALLPFAFWRLRPHRRLIALLAIGVAGNAVICATFSATADRYQGRLIWLLSLVVVASLLQGLRAGETSSTASAVAPPPPSDSIRSSHSALTS